MIVLTNTQKENFMLALAAHRPSMIAEGLDIQPIEIKNNLWILPEEILNDERFDASPLEAAGYTVREVSQDELINNEN